MVKRAKKTLLTLAAKSIPFAILTSSLASCPFTEYPAPDTGRYASSRYGTRLMRQASLRCIVEECPSQHRDRVGYRFFLLGKPQEDLLQRRPARLRPQFIHRPLGHYRSAIDDSDPGT